MGNEEFAELSIVLRNYLFHSFICVSRIRGKKYSFVVWRQGGEWGSDLVGVLRRDDIGVDGNVGAPEELTERSELLVPGGGGGRGEAPALAELGRGEGDDAPVPV